MPYIKKCDRKKFDIILKEIKCLMSFCQPGDLNYLITKILDCYIETKGQKYQRYNDLIGMLECCKLEYYRKRVSPYENIKEKENGDV